MTLFRWSTFLLRSQTVILTVWLFWISFFLPMLSFVPLWLSLHWEILIKFLSQFPLTFRRIYNRILHFIALLMTILVLIGMVFVIIWAIFHQKISLNSVLLLLLVNFVSRSRLELLHISLRTQALRTFGELLIVFLTKVNLLHLSYSTAQRCCLLHLIKQNYFLTTFVRTLILMTRETVSLPEIIWNHIIFL